MHSGKALLLIFVVLCIQQLLGAHAARASVRLPSILADHMVLQRGCPLTVWGWADPGEKVTVGLCGQSAQCLAGADGRWSARLGPFKPGGPFELQVKGTNAVTVHDVMIGDVWLCAGQSNMAFSVAQVGNAADEIARANNKQIRFFGLKRVLAKSVRAEAQGVWAACSPGDVGGFSAVGFFFGRELQAELKVPIGLIGCTYSGSPIEAWVSHDALAGLRGYAGEMAKWDAIQRNYDYEMQTFRLRRAIWRLEGQVARGFGWRQPKPPHPLPDLALKGGPSVVFNGMIAPILPYAIKGVIWEQGEADVGKAAMYRSLFPAMISSWRSRWREGDMPFYFVQLHNYGSGVEQKKRSALAELREAQTAALTLPHTGMVVSIDLGDDLWIHYRNKQAVGHRLAQAVLAGEFHRKVVAGGPELDRVTIDSNTAKVFFRNAAGGLKTRDGKPPRAFAVAGPDRDFLPAEAKIEGYGVVLWNKQIARPAYVRYAWSDEPDCNLVNSAGLPTAPFRTDR